MNRTLLAAALALSTASVTAESLWENGGLTDAGYRELAYQAVTMADWFQTREIAAHPEIHREANDFLGEHPSVQRVDAYFVGMMVGHAVIANNLSPERAKFWQYGLLIHELAAVINNKQLGVGFNIPLR